MGIDAGGRHVIWNKSWEDSKLTWEFFNVSNVTIYKAEGQILLPRFYEVAEVQN